MTYRQIKALAKALGVAVRWTYTVRAMELVLILGPMKSGKSIDLISFFSAFRYTQQPFALLQPTRNVRDETFWSRSGLVMNATKVATLHEALGKGYAAVGVDEMHMFPEDEADAIATLLSQGTRVFVSSLDTDFQGRLFSVVRRLLELGPKEVRYKRAVCDLCRVPDAMYTQVLRDDAPVTVGIPPSVADDGTFGYRSVCRNCFVRDGEVKSLPLPLAQPTGLYTN